MILYIIIDYETFDPLPTFLDSLRVHRSAKDPIQAHRCSHRKAQDLETPSDFAIALIDSVVWRESYASKIRTRSL